ncbi:MAG TPA: AraD1 family protein [Bryobacteraceae bacterium]|nr:AraD1 family protein [Bryobacteraceae bacterium]
MNIVQLLDKDLKRRVALVEGSRLRLISKLDSVYRIALLALEQERSLPAIVEESVGSDTLDYEQVWSGETDWSFLPCFDHPDEKARCLVSGTGLTHRKGAENRNAMHAEVQAETDSMRMYRWGVEGGRPEHGAIGTAPEWFYKGTGVILRAHLDPLEVPSFGEDGGEEPEIAGAYLIDWSGVPRHIGLATGNEFSDHMMERRNYLYLAPSKLRVCSIGPELALQPNFDEVTGTVRVLRGQQEVWSKQIATGEANMCHSLANIEHHHFKYEAHRQPGDVHVHFFGAGAFSFGEGITLEEGDVMEVAWEGFGRPLRNRLRIQKRPDKLVRTIAI